RGGKGIRDGIKDVKISRGIGFGTAQLVDDPEAHLIIQHSDTNCVSQAVPLKTIGASGAVAINPLQQAAINRSGRSTGDRRVRETTTSIRGELNREISYKTVAVFTGIIQGHITGLFDGRSINAEVSGSGSSDRLSAHIKGGRDLTGIRKFINIQLILLTQFVFLTDDFRWPSPHTNRGIRSIGVQLGDLLSAQSSWVNLDFIQIAIPELTTATSNPRRRSTKTIRPSARSNGSWCYCCTLKLSVFVNPGGCSLLDPHHLLPLSSGKGPESGSS